HVGACRIDVRGVLRTLIAPRAVKAPVQRLWLFALGGAPGMADRLALPLAVTFFPATRRGRGRRNGRRKVGAGLRDDPRAQLVAEHPGAHLLDLALGQFAELERPERYADEPRHGKPKRTQHIAHFAVLALADREGEPQVRALHAVERRFDRAVL